MVQRDDWIIGHGSIQIKKKIGHIFHVIIDSGYRRKGLASKLIKELKEKVHQKGVKEITLNVDRKNLAAFYLYEKLGFTTRRKISFWNLSLK